MRFLLQFRGLHNDLRLAEFYAALSAVRNVPETHLQASLSPAYSYITGRDAPTNPTSGDAGAVLYGEIFFYADLLSEAEAKLLAQRSVLLRGVYIPAGHGDDYASCITSIDSSRFAGALTPLRNLEVKPSFRCYVDAFGRSLSVEKQLEKIHQFSEVLRSFPGRVRMKRPDYELWILEDDFPRRGHGRRGDEGPRQVFLARKVASGQGHIRATYSLKTRRYIGPTSMDAELAFVMANMARVRPGDLVNDPFCGTGGVLVACAALGAICIGSDINILALRGKGKHTNITSNFKQYDLTPPIGLMRADVLHAPIGRGLKGWFDAVVCDPPYGIKEGTRAFRNDVIDHDLEGNHFQGTERVRFVDFLKGVLRYAADVLVEGGRLVYWLPTTTGYSSDDVPTHPALEIIHNNVQPLTTRMSRRLITLRRLTDSEFAENKRRLLELRSINGTNDSDAPFEYKPAHFDLACKLLRQPERAEDRLPSRRGVS